MRTVQGRPRPPTARSATGSTASFAPSAFSAAASAAHRFAERGDVVLAALAQPEQQHALGGEAGNALQQQRRARLAGQIAPASARRSAPPAALSARCAMRARFSPPCTASTRQPVFGLLGRQRPYAKFHRILL